MTKFTEKPQGIIFDFDGVIVDSERAKFEDLKRILNKKGIQLKEKDFMRMVGKKTAQFLKEISHNKLTQTEIEAIVKERRKAQLSQFETYYRAIKGATKFIQDVNDKNILTCIATGTDKATVLKTLQRLNIKFDKLVTGEEFTSSKPNPEVDVLASKKLGIPKKHILVIEDSPAGVRAAKRAGLRCIAITTTSPRKELLNAHADLVVRSFDDLQNISKSWV